MTDMNAGEKPTAAFSFLKHTGKHKYHYTGNQVTQSLFTVKRVTGKVHRMLRREKGSKTMFKAYTN